MHTPRCTPTGALALVALASLPTGHSLGCQECDNGYACGICLVLIETTDCPFGQTVSPSCEELPMGTMCEASGECGTTNDANNCPGRTFDFDIYKRVECTDDRPRPPPPPPSPPSPSPSPPRECHQCYAGLPCGMCLNLIDSRECNAAEEAEFNDEMTIDCRTAAVGQMCHADGSCGTHNDANNCPRRYGPLPARPDGRSGALLYFGR